MRDLHLERLRDRLITDTAALDAVLRLSDTENAHSHRAAAELVYAAEDTLRAIRGRLSAFGVGGSPSGSPLPTPTARAAAP